MIFFIHRVISYIKNGWEDTFLDKWQHLSDKQTVNKESVNTRTVTNTIDFPGSAEWTPLINAKNDVPAFNMQNIVCYFIDRKTKDEEANKDYKNVSNKAFGLFKHGHVQNIEISTDIDRVHFRCDCLPEMKKNVKYKLKLSLLKSGDHSGEIVYASCPCPAGKGPFGSCKHVAAICYALEEFTRFNSTREFETCTSRLQEWNQPRKRKLDAQSVYDIDFSKKVYGRVEKQTAKPLNDPRHPFHRDNDSKNANKELLDKIKKVKPDCGFFYLLSDEKLIHEEARSPPVQRQVEIIPPLEEQPVSLHEIRKRAEQIKRNLMVNESERQRIAEETRAQSDCPEWFNHRRIRITASKCKRAILKPTTSPTKAICDILHYNQQFQSNKMKQGLKDEKKIVKLYEDKVECKVDESGFLISSTHPFLGASPDGEVDGGLVEVKRIFSGESTLKEAICKRYICKESSNGLDINKNHKFYYQVQQQMFCAGCNWTDLVLSDMDDIIIIHIKKSRSFLSSIIQKLEKFYDDHISLELAYPRVANGLPRLSKLISRNY